MTDVIIAITRWDTKPEYGEEAGLLFCKEPLMKTNPRCHENVIYPPKGGGP